MRYSNRTSFLKHLKSASPDHLSRLYAVATVDDYDRRQIVGEVLKQIPDSKETVESFRGSELVVRDFLDRLFTPSLFGGEPVVVLEEGEKIPKASLSVLQEALSSGLSFGRLIVSLKGKSPLLGLIEKEGVVFDLLEEKPWDKEKRMAEFIETKARANKVTLASEAVQLLLELLEKDTATLDQELEKLFCYIGDRRSVESSDVLAIVSANRSVNVWQVADELIWERKMTKPFDESSFHFLISAARSQLQLGLKISSLLERNAPKEEWNQAMNKGFGKSLEKKTAAASHLKSSYFTKGLQALFELELMSRGTSSAYGALMDLFRLKLVTYAPR